MTTKTIKRIFPIWSHGQGRKAKRDHLHVDFSDGTKLVLGMTPENSKWKVGDEVKT